MSETIEFQKAIFKHTNEDGTVVPVTCTVDARQVEDGAYWASYIDPEDADNCIIDYFTEEELDFSGVITGKDTDKEATK